jgi:hypothetical protein
MAALVMLVSWGIWKERNAHVFWDQSTTAALLVGKIKEEVAMWCLARAKVLSNIMP